MVRDATPLGLAILGLLHQEPRSGYDLRKVFATTPMGYYSDSPGAIYPALRRLEEKGLVRGRVDGSKALRPRKVFSPTDEGLRALERWVTQPVTRDDVARGTDDLMLRFAFMGQLVDRQTTSRFLRSLAHAIDEHIAGLEPYLDGMQEPEAIHGRLALEAGIESYRSEARWARRALAEIEGLTPRPAQPGRTK